MKVFGALKAEARRSNAQALRDYVTGLVAAAIVAIATATVLAAAYAGYQATGSSLLVSLVRDTAGRL